MSKRVVPEYYTFDPSSRTITIPNRIIPKNQLLLVVNTSSNTVLYNFSDPDLTLTSYICPYDTTGTRFVLGYNTTAMSASDPIMIMEDEDSTRIDFSEVVQDPTNKLRVASPQSLIDTDFEYGLQPIKWESFGLVQNYPAFFFRSGGNSLDVNNIVGGNQTGRSTMTITTTVPHAVSTGDLVSVQSTNNLNADGVFQVLTIPTTTSLTYLAKAQINGTVYNPYCIVQGGQRYDSNNQSSHLITTTITSDNATTTSTLSGSMLTITTTGKHGLLKGSPILITGGAGTSASVNGSWYIYDIPTTTSFRAITVGSQTGTSLVTTSTVAVYVNPEITFAHRATDGGVMINTNIIQEGISAIRQTRRYFRYQSGKGITMSTGTKFTPSLDINTITASGTSVTCSIQQPLTFNTGVSVVISGVETNNGTANYYNGTFVIQAVNTTAKTFTYFTTSTNTDTAPGGQPFATIKNFKGAAIRAGMFDFQNGFYYEYDGQTLFAVRRDSVKEGMGTLTATNGSVTITGANTMFSKQLTPGEYIVIRGQSYQVSSIDTDTSMTITPKYRGTTLSGVRFNITRNTKFPQSQWNMDRCDGAGPSGFNLDMARMQMCYIDYTWYGAGTIRFGFRDANGNIIYTHRVPNNNRNFAAYMRSGNLPARYEVTNIGPFTRMISGNSNIVGQALTSATGQMTVKDAEYWPSSGAIVVQQDANIEYMNYTDRTPNLVIGGYDIGGLTRRVYGGTTSNVTFTPCAFDGGTGASVPSVTFVDTNVAPTISHWGTSVIMDGGYDEDRSIVFSYGKRRETIIAGGTSVAILSIRLAPSADNSITGALGVREIINRMQLKLSSVGSNATGPLLITGVLNPTRFTGAGAPALPATWGTTSVVSVIGSGSLAQVIDHPAANTTILGGEQIFSFFADAGVNTYELAEVRDLGNSTLGGDGSNVTPGYPNGPDVLVLMANSVTSNNTTLRGLRISWTEAQA